jgi:hypothetical protein
VQTAEGLRYCPVAQFPNGRVKPDVVLLSGKEERHTEGAYYIARRGGEGAALPTIRFELHYALTSQLGGDIVAVQ